MMKNSTYSSEIVVSVILVVLLALLLNPFSFFMPNAVLMVMAVVLVVVFGIYASFFWKENHQDERERFHKMMAGRLAYLAGISTLLVGIIVQSLQHNLNIWLVATLVIMIISKAVGLINSQRNY